MTVTDVTGPVALVLAAAALAWQIWKAHRDEARLQINTVLAVGTFGDGGKQARITYTVELFNYGGKPVTVTRVGWEPHEQDPYEMRRVAVTGGPPLPHRIDADHVERWTVTEADLARLATSELVRATATYVSRPRLLGRRRAEREVHSRWEPVHAITWTIRQALPAPAPPDA